MEETNDTNMSAVPIENPPSELPINSVERNVIEYPQESRKKRDLLQV